MDCFDFISKNGRKNFYENQQDWDAVISDRLERRDPEDVDVFNEEVVEIFVGEWMGYGKDYT